MTTTTTPPTMSLTRMTTTLSFAEVQKNCDLQAMKNTLVERQEKLLKGKPIPVWNETSQHNQSRDIFLRLMSGQQNASTLGSIFKEGSEFTVP